MNLTGKYYYVGESEQDFLNERNRLTQNINK